MMMMTADYSCGWLGQQHPNGLKTHPPAMPALPSSQPRKPLRHGIDAILHKTPSSSPSTNHSWCHNKPTLPHIETLRRSAIISTSAISGVSTASTHWRGSGLEVQSSHCVTPFEDGEDSRGDGLSHSCTDSSEEQEDVVVVVDDLNEAHNGEEDSAEEHSQDPEGSHNAPPVSDPVLQNLTQCGGLSPRNGNLPSSRSAFRTNIVDSSENVPQGSFYKVKSAFRPIVRPWQLANGAPAACSNDLNIKASTCRDHFRGVGNLHAKELGLRSLDAISMLRKQSTVFRVACHHSRPPVHKNPAMTTLTPPSLESGQPLPSSLTSWFSWLRSGGLHFSPHHSSQQFPPGAPPPPCRGGVVPASGVPVGPLPPQAPRYNCEACGKSYSTFGGLSKHKQFHCAAQIKKDFRCKFCDKSYSSLGALKMHIRTHTLPCKCTVCGKAFSRPWLLQGHLRTHTGEKPFSCPHCARAFADRSNLRAHLQTHSDVKKYSCRHCSKTFSRMSLLAKHRESSCLGLHS